MAMKGFFSEALAFGVLLAAAAVACTALSLRLRQRAEENDARASDRALYELGKRDAESAKADVEGPLGRMLRDAGIEASPVSWTLCLGTVGAFAAFFGMRASGLLGAMLGVGLVCIAAALYVLRARAKRRELLSRQFVRLVPQLSASVKSSLTLERALRVSADHAPEPLRSELMAVLARVSYGMPLVQALARMAQSTGDADVAALASAMRIQQRFGGSMGAVLDLIRGACPGPRPHAAGAAQRTCGNAHGHGGGGVRHARDIRVHVRHKPGFFPVLSGKPAGVGRACGRCAHGSGGYCGVSSNHKVLVLGALAPDRG